MTKKAKVITKEDILELKVLPDSVETFELIIPEDIYEDEFRRDLPTKLENTSEIGGMIAKMKLLAEILENTDSLESIAAKVDDLYQEVNDCYEANMEVVFKELKPFERTVRSLSLLYQNAGGEAPVYILPVDANKFADSDNPKHFEIMRAFLRKQYFKFKMENSPFYIGYIGEIGKTGIQQMAGIAHLTQALSILDLEPKSSVKAAINSAKQLAITGLSAKFGHLVIPGTWVYANGAIEYTFDWDENQHFQKRDKTKMAVPAAPIIIGKMLSAAPGDDIASLEADPMIGIDGVTVKYNEERNDAKAMDEAGLVMIEPNGYIEGTSTCNKSGNADLRKFPKVDTANALLKDLVQFCNNKANAKWGKKEQQAFQKEVESYLNRRMKQELIEGYQIERIEYDTEEETVNIDISVIFYEVADTFEIHLHGPKRGIDNTQA